MKFAVDTYGGLDVAVNNAGIGGASAPTGEYPLDSWQKVIDVNLNGVQSGLAALVPPERARAPSRLAPAGLHHDGKWGTMDVAS